MSTVFSRNLKALRLSKALTQEQAAERLGVSPQSVSRWECGSTFPDVMLLPEIARLYCVTVDDLYQEKSTAYENYAQRLLSVYEDTRRPEDFMRAEAEYRRLFSGGSCNAADLRAYGVLHQIMMNYCRKQALESFDRVLASENPADAETVRRTRQQRLMLRCQIGQGADCVREQRELLRNSPDNLDNHIMLLAACHFSGAHEDCLDAFRVCSERFPDAALPYIYAGDSSRCLGRTEEAFALWNRALELDDSVYDVRFSMAFCLEELGEYAKAYALWLDIAERLKKDGFEIEPHMPLTRAEECRRKM